MTKKVNQDIHEIWFMMSENDKFQFIEDNIQIFTTKGTMIPLKLVDFQRRWFLDGPLFNDYTKESPKNNRIMLKCRGVGASAVCIAAESVLTSWIYSGIFIPFLSAGEDQAKDLIIHCKKIVEHAKFSINLVGGLENQSSSRLNFSNGSVIRSFASGRPETVRGPRALVSYCDEFAFVRNAQEIMSAVEYFHIEGGQMNILSTVWGRNNLYWKVWADREVFRSWGRHYVGLFTDMDKFDITVPLQDQISQYGLELSAPWQDIGKLEKKRWEDSPNAYCNFLQETAGVPFEEASAAISSELLDTIGMDYKLVESVNWELEENNSRKFIIGADFGAERNATGLVIIEAIDGRFVVVNTYTLIGNVDEQINRIVDIFNIYNPKYFVGDGTGLGGKSFMDILSNRAGESVVVSVNYSKKDYALASGIDMNNKNYFVTKMIKLMGEGNIIVPKNFKRLREEILGLEKLVYEKSIKYSGKKGVVGSDDLAMAFLQCAVVYDNVYSFGGEINSYVDSGRGMSWEDTKNKNRPIIKKVEFTEVAGATKNLVEKRDTSMRGFDKLI